MNISQAIQQIISAVRSCLAVDESGNRIIPISSQRPILLYGPPGIGKTAIVRQAAAALNIAFLSYTMTHHTRQSALGLPQVIHRRLNGTDHAVTEYTMSDIMRDVYEAADCENGEHGILFLDEINCVSETLMPAMLELLQFKRFGKHALPDGWVIVCAGNPEEYNRSAHAFDPVTTDRVRMIRVEPDLESWLKYAGGRKTHPTILSYLQLRPEHLSYYSSEGAITPRSWSDLSSSIKAAEMIGDTPDSLLFEQFLQCSDICDSYTLYYAMCKRSDSAFSIQNILNGDHAQADAYLPQASFDEQVYLSALLADRICMHCESLAAQRNISDRINNFLQGMNIHNGTFAEEAHTRLSRMEQAYSIRRNADLISPTDVKYETAFLKTLRSALSTPDPEAFLRSYANTAAEQSAAQQKEVMFQTQNGIDFADRTFTDSSLRVVFVTSLRENNAAMAFMRSHPLPSWQNLLSDCDMRSRSANLKLSLRGGLKS